MIRIHEIKLKTDQELGDMCALVERRLRLPNGSIKSCRLVKESIDAREKSALRKIFFIPCLIV